EPHPRSGAPAGRRTNSRYGRRGIQDGACGGENTQPPRPGGDGGYRSL
ncbi:MAG: hypothetical protein AVDCRST_MAG77-3349, partial [uncultured Chloroflexi bacterium]